MQDEKVDYRSNLEQAMHDEYKDQFWALHPFSRDCEGIWDHNCWMMFTPDEFYEACQDV